MNMKKRHLFGPVPSRRLGISLGVDLVPMKTCTLDCVYCECGATTNLTVTRKDYFCIGAVLAELDRYLQDEPILDYITFSGSGEPTLNSALGDVVSYLKRNYPQYKLCLLTNGTLFPYAQVRDAVNRIDRIIPSLDAASEGVFQKINRPHQDLTCAGLIEGIRQLRAEFDGEMILEVFIIPGLNDTEEELALLKQAIEKIRPDAVQLGTLDRPGTEEWVEAAEHVRMLEIARFLESAELIGDYRPRRNIASFKQNLNSRIEQTIARRPCTIEDLEQVCGMHRTEIMKYLDHLLSAGKIKAERRQRGIFYRLTHEK